MIQAALLSTRLADGELALLIRKGQQSGAQALYDTYARFLFFAILRIVPERKMAESILLASLKKIWYAIDEYAVEKDRIYTWMMAIARETAFETLARPTNNYETKNEGV